MKTSARLILALAILWPMAAPASAVTTIYSSQGDYLLAAGALRSEDLETHALVGDAGSGAVGVLPFTGFRAVSDPAGLKVLDVEVVGNHNTTAGGSQYLSADTDSLESATVTLQFTPSVDRVGFSVVDLDTFAMEVTINGVTYVIPTTGDGGQAYFGIISDTSFDEVLLAPMTGDVHYSLDDFAYPNPPLEFGTGWVPNGGSRPGTPLTLSPEPGGDLLLTWGDSCHLTDSDFGIYEGVIGEYPSHVPLGCTTRGAISAIVTPSAGSMYYLIVPHGQAKEGSHGLASDGSERPRPVSACNLPGFISCP